MSVTLSFTSALRFSIDSNRSPTMPASTSNTPSSDQPQRIASRAATQFPATISTAGATTSPPIAPSMVFFGLTARRQLPPAERPAA